MSQTKRDRTIEILFSKLIDCDTSERNRILADECKNDPSLGDEVLGLLRMADSDKECPDFLPDISNLDLQMERHMENSAEPLPTGHTLGQYEILASIGSGGMGQVYRVRHKKLGKVFALKILPRTRATSPSNLVRFEQEIASLGKLDHPNIVRASDAGEFEGAPFLVMEYVEGRNLLDVLKQESPMKIEVCCDLIRQAAIGLEHAHQKGLVHRDLKPSNMILSQNGTLKLVDFGVALLMQSAGEKRKSDSQIFGTLETMAPEQAQPRANVDARSDVYGLGATFYKLLCNRPPRDLDAKKSLAEILQDVRKLNPIDPRVYRADLPEGLSKIILSMVAIDPNDRPPSAQAVVESLSPWLPAKKQAEYTSHDDEGLLARTSKSRTFLMSFSVLVVVLLLLWQFGKKTVSPEVPEQGTSADTIVTISLPERHYVFAMTNGKDDAIENAIRGLFDLCQLHHLELANDRVTLVFLAWDPINGVDGIGSTEVRLELKEAPRAAKGMIEQTIHSLGISQGGAAMAPAEKVALIKKPKGVTEKQAEKMWLRLIQHVDQRYQSSLDAFAMERISGALVEPPLDYVDCESELIIILR